MCLKDNNVWQYVQARTHSVPTLAVPHLVAPAAPFRVGLVFSNDVAGAGEVSTSPSVVTTQGILIDPFSTGQKLVLAWPDWGGTIQSAWYAVANSGALTVTELYLPESVWGAFTGFDDPLTIPRKV